MQTDTLGRKPPGLIGYLAGSGTGHGPITVPAGGPRPDGGGREPATVAGRETKVDPPPVRSS
ncbi:hypothetical protein Ae168Ps1_0549c [Pseudonocardia sp. Ae168_Ps1]|nr:hypothetical protein Ae150APs1_0553c [Pseudonocardia sp. Ae150A_Ps1]OLL78143.1 hypothetical protein Ae168Ps1_0549c [Pseudonocardia sp. Ae168_Ps1]OLL87734.1 hypothetical protein Ae263Ps1_4789 [Pseudonocardia sp. Ae263_Ps1]